MSDLLLSYVHLASSEQPNETERQADKQFTHLCPWVMPQVRVQVVHVLRVRVLCVLCVT